MTIPQEFDEANEERRNELMKQCGCSCHTSEMQETHIMACCAYSGRKISKK
jgi:hypothetical protein